MTEETKGQEEEAIFINPKNKRLLSLATWAGTISWLIVIIFAIQIIYELFLQLTNQATPIIFANQDVATKIMMISAEMNDFIRTAFYFFILQTMKETLLLVIDIREEKNAIAFEGNDASQS